jgi:hypothetical protein|tara:strand:- start:554 stop:694 length:141 start_codon:yes stop_codon:yes gene_type:complete
VLVVLELTRLLLSPLVLIQSQLEMGEMVVLVLEVVDSMGQKAIIVV